ncbi:MAG: hypothetical protein AAF715_00800 [Myxococcota bacterium]
MVPPPPAVAGASTSTPVTSNPAPAPANATRLPTDGQPCGPLRCRHFASVPDALQVVLATEPLVLGVGEAHAQKGTEGIASSTHRFTEGIVPLLRDRASDLVIELTVGQNQCRPAVEKTEEATKSVTQSQASTNKSEFVVLGERAQAEGLRPHVLRPSCADFDRIARAPAGADRVVAMLTLIADQSASLLRKILARNVRTGRPDALVLAYGGALHNDLAPDEGKEAWSFGPAMARHTEGRFVELDLFVPEYIRDTPSWRAMPWHEHYDGDSTPPGAVTLFQPGERSFVLIFARSTFADRAGEGREADGHGDGGPARED